MPSLGFKGSEFSIKMLRVSIIPIWVLYCLLALLRPYAAGAYYHHEALNGSGYPQGLTRKDIPYEAQIIRVADEFEAISVIVATFSQCFLVYASKLSKQPN